MATATQDMTTRMVEWRRRRMHNQQSGGVNVSPAEQRKHEAWEQWKARATYENLTLREIVDGPGTRAWTPEMEARERRLFEEFWAEETAQ